MWQKEKKEKDYEVKLDSKTQLMRLEDDWNDSTKFNKK